MADKILNVNAMALHNKSSETVIKGYVTLVCAVLTSMQFSNNLGGKLLLQSCVMQHLKKNLGS